MDPKDLLKQLESRIAQRKLYLHLPYGHKDTLCPDGRLWKDMKWESWSNKPWQMDFHEAGKSNQERMLICANRVGKSESNTFEIALHMTGCYPDWWPGRRFEKPVLVWTGSPTNETSRDIMQKMLLGGTSKEELGTGFIPREKIIGRPKMRQAGVSDVVDTFKVRHITGGVSTCVLKTYEQGWRKWQGTAPHVVALDEEPEDFKIYTESLTRLLTSHGIMMVTFTPLLGNTKLVTHFRDGGVGIWVGKATWEDAPHLDRTERDRMADSYPEHERDARIHGVPMMGEGAIFTEPEKNIVCDPIDIQAWWPRLNGIDFGIDHPFGLGRIAWDRDRDIIYVYDTYRVKNKEPVYHVEKINAGGKWIKTAWPHDGANREKGSGKQVKDYYRKLGGNLLGRSARYKNDKAGAQPQWPVIEEIREREATGRFKVFSTCHEYLEERRDYHVREDKLGRAVIHNRNDDVLKAVFYAVMMKRYASVKMHTEQQVPAAIMRMA